MKRAYRRRSEEMVKSAEGEQGFWPSYADMMSAVALILFFLMLLSYIQNLITGNTLQDTKEQLENTELNLSDTLTALTDTREQLSDLESSLALTMQQVEDARTELDAANADLDQVKLSLAEKENELATQDRQLAEQQALIAEQDEYLQAANQELLEMHGQMQTIVGLRLTILEQIRDSVVNVMGDASRVSIGDNGNIVLNEGIFFDSGKAVVKEEGRAMLNQLADVFQQFLSDPENAKYVESVVISGHTDSDGDEDLNRSLSSERANAVLGYLLDSTGGKLSAYAPYFCAAGYGETRPVADNSTNEGKAQNRRIEISIILRDDTVMEIVNDYLNIDLPASVDTAAGS
ncbi:MAG: OmpA family protein [Oscillospiraceae bacterium]|nr:OmpA family protein [Oscillospiraceae bacterium]